MSETSTALDLKSAWADLKVENPHLRIRDAAAQLGVSEAELLVTDCGSGVTRLRPDWYDILPDLEGLGEVMALTRNDLMVHEKVGRYSKVSVWPERRMGQTLDEGIDLRIFFRNWAHAFAVVTETPDMTRRSIQFFDAAGEAVHKTHLRRTSDVEYFDKLVEKYRHENQSTTIEIEPAPEPAPEKPDHEIDAGALRKAWSELRDTHDFIFMLRKFEVSRLQAFRIAGREFARPVATQSFRNVLEKSAESGIRIMVFVGNHGCIQIHSGPVSKLKEMHGWFNVLDPGFNLHAKDDELAEAWIVRKPVESGHVHSLEVFDASGEVVCYLFSKRYEGEAENEVWREIVAELG